MNLLRELYHSGKCTISIRLYHAVSSTVTLCIASIISSIAVFILLQLWNFENIHQRAFISLILYCLLTMIIGGFFLSIEARHDVKPIESVSNAASLVSKGDFNIQLEIPDRKVGITELNSLIDNFNRMVNELAKTDRMRKEFTSNVSHELKTPLASITGWTEILLDDNITDEERKEYLSLLHDEALRLSHLSKNILQLSRLDAQEIITRHDIVSVDEQMKMMISELKFEMKV